MSMDTDTVDLVSDDSNEVSICDPNSCVKNDSMNDDDDTGNYPNVASGTVNKVFADTAPIVIAPQTTPRRRGRPPKAESERLRLAALYHSGNETKDSNGISTEPYIIQLATPTQRRKGGRPPKSDSEKNNRPKGSIRIALGPKTKVRRIEAASPNDEASPFPLVQQTDSVKKSRGRPRIHPPKDPSVKRPRGRPRIIPLEGEQALRSAYLKLKRDCNKKDLIIQKLLERLKEFGHSADDILHEQSKSNSQENDEADEEQKEEHESGEEAGMTPKPSSMEDTHQTYLGMFADNENKDKEDSDTTGEESE